MGWRATEATEPGLAAATRGVLATVLGTWPRRALVTAIPLVGLAVGLAVATGGPARASLATLALPVHSVMSILVPLLGSMSTRDLAKTTGPARIAPTYLAALLLAAAVGVVGGLICVVLLLVFPAAPDPWVHALDILIGGVLVQTVAQLVGTGLGLFLRSSVVAFVASIVLPLGLWYLLGAVAVLRSAQGWLAPFSSVQNQLSGQMTGTAWAQWCVILLLWGIAFNTAGVAAWKRRRLAQNPA